MKFGLEFLRQNFVIARHSLCLSFFFFPTRLINAKEGVKEQNSKVTIRKHADSNTSCHTAIQSVNRHTETSLYQKILQKNC